MKKIIIWVIVGVLLAFMLFNPSLSSFKEFDAIAPAQKKVFIQRRLHNYFLFSFYRKVNLIEVQRPAIIDYSKLTNYVNPHPVQLPPTDPRRFVAITYLGLLGNFYKYSQDTLQDFDQ